MPDTVIGLVHEEQMSVGRPALGGKRFGAFTDVRNQEKERLKHLVRSFASSALRGVPCSIVDLKTGQVVDGEYSIDRTLRSFALTPTGWRSAKGPGSATFEISRITDVCGSQAFSASTSAADLEELQTARRLSPAESDRLVILGYQDRQGTKRLAALLEADREARDSFANCMNVLRLYAEVLS